ncbi:cyclin-J-like protein [Cricetulus griseus]|nr:cyclin-J-like protein [Cricetulus griseus]
MSRGGKGASPRTSTAPYAKRETQKPWQRRNYKMDATLRERGDGELKLPTFRAHSPLLKSRRFFVDILTLLSRHCHLCPSARHLAIYLLDHFMDQYNITTSKQLYTVAVSCLLLARSTLSKEASLKTANLWPSVLGEDSSILYCSLDELLTTQDYLTT